MADAGLHRRGQLVGGLPHSAEYDSVGREPGREGARRSSPTETMSAPGAEVAQHLSTARLLLALTA